MVDELRGGSGEIMPTLVWPEEGYGVLSMAEAMAVARAQVFRLNDGGSRRTGASMGYRGAGRAHLGSVRMEKREGVKWEGAACLNEEGSCCAGCWVLAHATSVASTRRA